jgi:hypothetical protein
MLGDFRIDELSAMVHQTGKRPLLILPHQPRVSRNIGCQNGR